MLWHFWRKFPITHKFEKVAKVVGKTVKTDSIERDWEARIDNKTYNCTSAHVPMNRWAESFLLNLFEVTLVLEKSNNNVKRIWLNDTMIKILIMTTDRL